MRELRIAIDPGHGGRQGLGATSPYAREADINRIVAKALCQTLNDVGDEVLPFLTPAGTTENTGEDLARRADFANRLDAHCFVSIHCNSFHDVKVHGFEVFTSHGFTRADNLATAVIDKIQTADLGFKLRADESDGDKDKEAHFQVLHQTAMPAVLIELGFVSNQYDAGRLNKWTTQRNYARAIADGILAWAKKEGF